MKQSFRTHWIWLVVVALFFGLYAFTPQLTNAADAMSAKDMIEEAKEHGVKEITVEEAKAKVDAGGNLVLLDVREPDEFDKGHLPKAMNIPRGLLEFQIEKKVPDKSTPIIVYCKTGGRSCLGTDTLMKMGYTNVFSMAGGWKAWLKAGYPIE
jgi:rhodanese-related sulfurtransferase